MYSCCLPPPDLAPHVRLFWGVAAPQTALREVETIVPDGCCELVVHAGRPYLAAAPGQAGLYEAQPQALVHGQLQRAISLLSDGPVDFVAVRFEPAGIASLFGIDTMALQAAAVPLLDLFGVEGRVLSEQVRECADMAGRWQLLTAFMRRHRVTRMPRQAGLAQVVAANLAHRPGSAVLARELGYSWRSIERAFKQMVGLTPRQFLRLQRVSQAAAALQQGDRPALADLAAHCGYADQAHFSREFAELVGVSPGRFARAAEGAPPPIVAA